MVSKFKRPVYSDIYNRVHELNPLIQVLLGPRQVGKTTLAHQLIEEVSLPAVMASADGPGVKDSAWIEQQWQAACLKSQGGPGLLVIDEVQKVQQWTEALKLLWDQKKVPLKVVLLGSAQMSLQKGLSESLAGRFEVIPINHWSYAELKAVHAINVEEYIYFGGYPKIYELRQDDLRWKMYARNSLIETSLNRDLLALHPVDKVGLFRNTFELACHYSGRELSYNKMLGQLQDAGNTTTLAHYLQLLDQAFLVAGLQKFAGQEVKRRGSSPKFQVYNNALKTAFSERSFSDSLNSHEEWGRLVESAVGAHLLNLSRSQGFRIFYWREGPYEVDFVVQLGSALWAIEVKSQLISRVAHSGLSRFKALYPHARLLLVGPGGVDLSDFFQMDFVPTQ